MMFPDKLSENPKVEIRKPKQAKALTRQRTKR